MNSHGVHFMENFTKLKGLTETKIEIKLKFKTIKTLIFFLNCSPSHKIHTLVS